MNAIFLRHSVRKFTNREVEESKITHVLRAAMQAPSAGNQQPWEFLVVRDPEQRRLLAKVSPYAAPAMEAPVCIVILGNRGPAQLKHPAYLVQDLSAATQNLLLEVVDQGLGAVWLGVAPLEERIRHVANLFNLGPDLLPFAIIPVGYPASEPPPVDRFDPRKIHHEKY